MSQKIRSIAVVFLSVLVITPTGDYHLTQFSTCERNCGSALRSHVAKLHPDYTEAHYWLSSDVLPSGKVFA
jgi:hypothetical protein